MQFVHWTVLRTTRNMSSSSFRTEEIYSHAKNVYSAAIEAVSPMQLVSNALCFDKLTSTLTVGDAAYKLHKNVKVIAFGKAVLGMVAAVEEIIGEHIVRGVASVPLGTQDIARTQFPQYLPPDTSKVRICEGARNNLPDTAAESAAKEILKIVEEAEEDELILALISGGGSALLPYPVNGVTLEEKKQVIDNLARQGADIDALNTFRKALSLTKGGRLAEAAYPSKLLALILSDVIGDPLETIASGPTVPNHTTTHEVLALLDEYLPREEVPLSIIAHLSKSNIPNRKIPISSSGQYAHTQNVLVGTNRVATEAALSAAKALGYSGCVWSQTIQGEARELGEVFAALAHNCLLAMEERPHQETNKLQVLTNCSQELKNDMCKLHSSFYDMLRSSNRRICFISGGEPTVTVRGSGRGGRNQEMALAFALRLNELRGSNYSSISHCVLASLGTDGQDGPCDAAGAVVDSDVIHNLLALNLDPVGFLENNDTYTYFSRLNNGKHQIKTGLTGTNVMDIHLLFLASN